MSDAPVIVEDIVLEAGGVARVLTSDKLEPAWGSLRHMVPDQRPANSFLENTSL